jgi:hypothetical protein
VCSSHDRENATCSSHDNSLFDIFFQDIEVGLSDVAYVLQPMSNNRFNDSDEDQLDQSDDVISERGAFDRGFTSAFLEEEGAPLLLRGLSSSILKPLSPEASAALANEKWRRKKQRHVSFYGSVSDCG